MGDLIDPAARAPRCVGRPLPGAEPRGEAGFLTTRVQDLLAWCRRHSLWAFPLGVSCCGVEFTAAAAGRYDLSRLGVEEVRTSPRQADLLVVAGTVTYKMADVVKRVYEQMGDPRWVIAVGACAASGGMFRTYSVVQGVDEVLPVDFYVSGCPPRPEAVIDCLRKLQEQIAGRRDDP